MASRKVFISYSAKSCRASQCARASAGGPACAAGGCARQAYERQFVADLVNTLDTTFEVLWDATALLAGDDWRQKLYSAFADCQAAVILLTESAVDSHYVPLEAMVLAWRRLLDPEFLVVPVFFDPLDENSVKRATSRFYGIGLEDIQGVKHRRGHEQETYGAIHARLAKVTDSVPLDRIAVVHELAGLLGGVDPALLESAAAELDQEYEWRPGMPRPFQLALALLQENLGKAVRALSNVVRPLAPDDRKRLFDLFAPRWVDLRAAKPLWSVGLAKEPQAKPVLAINAAWKVAPAHYVQRAWSHTSKEVAFFPITAIDDGSGEGFREAILREYRTQFPLPDDDEEWDESTAADVIDRMRRRAEQGLPVYVAIKHGTGVSERALVNVQNELPVTIVYVRPDATPEMYRDRVLLLTPPLTTDLEATARTEWANAHDVLIGQKGHGPQ